MAKVFIIVDDCKMSLRGNSLICEARLQTFRRLTYSLTTFCQGQKIATKSVGYFCMMPTLFVHCLQNLSCCHFFAKDEPLGAFLQTGF